MKKFPAEIVVDCSVTIPWFFEEQGGAFADSILSRAGETALWVPALWTLEFANVLIAARKRGRLTEEQHGAILDQAGRLPWRIDDTVAGMGEITALAMRHRLTSYDAAYLELSLRRRLPLATLDGELRQAAKQAKVILLG